MAVKKLEDAAAQAALDVAEFITQDLQASANQHGWDSEAVKKTRVVYTGKAYDLSVAPEVEHRVMNFEYGTEVTPPTAVVRKYSNNTKKAERFFIQSMEKQLGVKL